MKPKNRRDILREMVALLAAPLSLGTTRVLAQTDSNRVTKDAAAVGSGKRALRRATIAPPKGSVMRRG